jgi:hypothetical protein
MLTILAFWAVGSAPLGILIGTVIRKIDEAPDRGASAATARGVSSRTTASRQRLRFLGFGPAGKSGLPVAARQR